MHFSQGAFPVKAPLPFWRRGAAAAVLMLSGCTGLGDVISSGTTLTVQQPANEKFFPSDEAYRQGVEQFNRGNYGLAELYFREAVEKAPGDGTPWLALASSYDRLGRFDLADRAYAHALELQGETLELLNNQGYSQMLRGNLKSARRKFLQAAALDPDNTIIQNNIKLLDGGSAYLSQAASSPQTQ